MAKWAQRGLAAAKAFEQEHQQKQAAQESQSKMWRFYLKDGEEARITFIDGNLDEHGVLDAFSFPQHQVFANGKWNNFFVCTKHDEPCPLCESGDTPTRVAALTIIDHRKHKSSDGKKVYENQKRLFVMKHDTYEILQKIAAKRGGLAGLTVDVFRSGERSPNVGNSFDVIEKHDVEMLKGAFTKEVKGEDGSTKTVTNFYPADYEQEIPYYTADQLAAMGFGAVAPSMGSMESSSAPKADYSSQL